MNKQLKIVLSLILFLTTVGLNAQDNSGNGDKACELSEYMIEGKETPVNKWCEGELSDDKVYVVVSQRARMEQMARSMMKVNAISDFGRKMASFNGDIENVYSAMLDDEGEVVYSETSSQFEAQVPQPANDAFECVEGSSKMCYGLYSVTKQKFIDMYEKSLSEEERAKFNQFKGTEEYQKLLEDL